jgi:ribonucleotide reductase beta subunit family protein with ferritin-like domain
MQLIYLWSGQFKAFLAKGLLNKMLLEDNPNRFVLLPIKHNTLWNLYKKAMASFWTAEELDFASDKRDWASLNDGQRLFIETVLAFFAASDGIINENLAANFMSEVQVPEARCFYGFQIAMENIHSETYGLLIESYVTDADRRAQLFDGLNTFKSIRAKADWALKWTSKEHASFGERLVAFACVEGISFSSSFCSIFYLKKQGLLCQGLGKSNELIARDEGMHRDFACELFKMLLPQERPSNDTIKDIIQECVDVETHFVNEALPVAIIGMNSKHMIQYVEFVADALAMALGLPKIYNSENPFPWMEVISLQGKTNFFEARVTEYSRPGVGLQDSNGIISVGHEFSLSEDF